MASSSSRPNSIKDGYTEARTASTGHRTSTATNTGSATPIHQNQGHIRALRFLLKDYGNIPYISIVAFSRQASLGIDALTPVIYWDQIPRIINQFETRVLSESQIQSIYNILLANNNGDKAAKKQHISNVRHNELKRDIAVANGYCPQCGGTLTLRQGKYGKFYGCSNYPHCKYTTPYR